MVEKENKRKQLFVKYLEAHSLYQYTDKKDVLKQIEENILHGDLSEAERLLKTLKMKDELLEKLSSTLRGKAVYKTLRKMLRGGITNDFEGLKGMTSLMTHILIECEMGNMEYLPLLFETNDTVQMLLGRLKK